jgi:hypothetical protein
MAAAMSSAERFRDAANTTSGVPQPRTRLPDDAVRVGRDDEHGRTGPAGQRHQSRDGTNLRPGQPHAHERQADPLAVGHERGHPEQGAENDGRAEEHQHHGAAREYHRTQDLGPGTASEQRRDAEPDAHEGRGHDEQVRAVGPHVDQQRFVFVHSVRVANAGIGREARPGGSGCYRTLIISVRNAVVLAAGSASRHN